MTMPTERITRGEIEAYKREIMEQSVLVTPKAAAAMLAKSERVIYSLVEAGELSAHNGGSRRSKGLRILAASLRDYVRRTKIDKDDLAA